MISPKLAMLTAFMAAASVGAFAVPAMAQDIDQDISRDNTNNQFIAQSNEACTNTVAAFEDNSGDQYVKADQSNKCYVEQSNTATQTADITDNSRNILANLGFQLFDEED
jgi:glucose dehydrogenase